MMMDEFETKLCLRSFSIECSLNKSNTVTCDNYYAFISQITDVLFHKLQMFISQSIDFHLISFGKLLQ